MDMTSQVKDMENFFNNDIFKARQVTKKTLHLYLVISYLKMSITNTIKMMENIIYKNVNLTIKKQLLRWLVIMVVAVDPH